MSLDYDLKKIPNRENLCWMDDPNEPGQRCLQAVTYSLIWISIPCGFDEITSKNAPNLYQRIRVFEKINGSMNRKWVDGKPVDIFLTYKDVLDHVGLVTNVSTKTEAAFKRDLMENFYREEQRTTNQLIAKHFETPESGEKDAA